MRRRLGDKQAGCWPGIGVIFGHCRNLACDHGRTRYRISPIRDRAHTPIGHPRAAIGDGILENTDFRPIVISDTPIQGVASGLQVSAMSDMTTSSEESSARFFLQERELWESLEFDWEDWNATVEKILQQQSAQSPTDQD